MTGVSQHCSIHCWKVVSCNGYKPGTRTYVRQKRIISCSLCFTSGCLYDSGQKGTNDLDVSIFYYHTDSIAQSLSFSNVISLISFCLGEQGTGPEH